MTVETCSFLTLSVSFADSSPLGSAKASGETCFVLWVMRGLEINGCKLFRIIIGALLDDSFRNGRIHSLRFCRSSIRIIVGAVGLGGFFCLCVL